MLSADIGTISKSAYKTTYVCYLEVNKQIAHFKEIEHVTLQDRNENHNDSHLDLQAFFYIFNI